MIYFFCWKDIGRKVLKTFKLLDIKIWFLCKFGNRKNIEIQLLGRLTKRTIITKISFSIFLYKFPYKRITLWIGPWITKCEKMLSFTHKGMFKGQLKPLLSLCYSILLYCSFYSWPFCLLIVSKDRNMPLFKEFYLITHINDHKGNCCSLRDAFDWEEEPCFIGRVWICLDW
jgi:hypothetical protein